MKPCSARNCLHFTCSAFTVNWSKNAFIKQVQMNICHTVKCNTFRRDFNNRRDPPPTLIMDEKRKKK